MRFREWLVVRRDALRAAYEVYDAIVWRHGPDYASWVSPLPPQPPPTAPLGDAGGVGSTQVPPEQQSAFSRLVAEGVDKQLNAEEMAEPHTVTRHAVAPAKMTFADMTREWHNCTGCHRTLEERGFIEDGYRYKTCNECRAKSRKRVAIKRFREYRNPDNRCHYPFTPDMAGYCWSYANHVDGTEGYQDIQSRCTDGPCEFWKDESKRAAATPVPAAPAPPVPPAGGALTTTTVKITHPSAVTIHSVELPEPRTPPSRVPLDPDVDLGYIRTVDDFVDLGYIRTKRGITNPPPFPGARYKQGWRCATCGERFPTRKRLRTHRQNAHPKPLSSNPKVAALECTGCGGIFRLRREFEQHKCPHSKVPPRPTDLPDGEKTAAPERPGNEAAKPKGEGDFKYGKGSILSKPTAAVQKARPTGRLCSTCEYAVKTGPVSYRCLTVFDCDGRERFIARGTNVKGEHR